MEYKSELPNNSVTVVMVYKDKIYTKGFKFKDKPTPLQLRILSNSIYETLLAYDR